MDEVADSGRRIEHAQLPISLSGYPQLIPGIVNKALSLNGNQQYIDMGENGDECLGNLDLCKFGLSLFFWLNIDQYDNNMYILSTGTDGVRVYYNQGYIYVTLNNDRKSWRVSVPELAIDTWHFVELSWHPDKGLSFYVDDNLRATTGYRDIPAQLGEDERHFYIGRPNPYDVQGQSFTYGHMAVDELEIWYSTRDILLAFEYIIRGIQNFVVTSAFVQVVIFCLFVVCVLKDALPFVEDCLGFMCLVHLVVYYIVQASKYVLKHIGCFR